MRIGVISDIHGNLPGLEASLLRLRELGAESVICLGDLVQYGPYPSEVVDLVRERGIETVQGNCDRAAGKGRDSAGDRFENVYWESMARDVLQWTMDQLDSHGRRFLRNLPTELRFRLGRSRLLCVHGRPGEVAGSVGADTTAEVCAYILNRNSCDILAAGHTHEMFLQPMENGFVFNPGSVGGGTLPGESTIAVLDMDDRTETVSVSWHRVPFDTESYAARYRKEGLPETFLRCLLLGRDPRGKWLTRDIDRRQRWEGR